ncbi:MAG TPA: helix-turn-helix transcriptional regulator [Trebonia sp.]
MTYNWSRLAHRIRKRRTELGLTQADVADQADVTVMTVRNLETGREFKRLPHALPAVERALGWEPGSAQAVLDDGEPTPRRQTGQVDVQDVDNAPADPRSASSNGLNLRVQTTLERGETVDQQILEWPVGGESFSVVLVAKVGEYVSEEERAAMGDKMIQWAKAVKRIERALDTPDGEGGD